MFAQVLPWFIVTLLVGIVIGLIVGILIASALAKGHYRHFVSNTQPMMQEYPYETRQPYPRR